MAEFGLNHVRTDVRSIDDLNSDSLRAAYHQLFATHEGVPPQLYQPAESLCRALNERRPVEKQIADLAEMSLRIDLLFRQHLAPLAVFGQQPEHSEELWTIALAQWAELLNAFANLLLRERILPTLFEQGFAILPLEECSQEQTAWLHDHFQEHIYPLLTPLAVDPGRPFPYISSDSLNLLVELIGSHRITPSVHMARVKIPILTPRLIQLPPLDSTLKKNTTAGTGQLEMVWSSILVRHFVPELFVDIPIRRIFCFRVIRAAEVNLQQTGEIEPVRGRAARGSVVRVDVEAGMPSDTFDWLVKHLDVIAYSVVRYHTPDIDMSLPELSEAVNAWKKASGTQ